MNIARTVQEVRTAVSARRARNTPSAIAFVPTMGALHDGHVTLFRAAGGDGAMVVGSIFVNPAQFNDPADLAAYPRQEARDVEIATAAGVDLMFLPGVDEIYPHGHATTVHVEGAALGYEGAHRPGHFDGVATVCVKLFDIVQPDVAHFGQKDAQQVAVLRQVVRDLNLPIEIRVVPTVREPNGLALSSRNARLSSAEKEAALAIPRALRAAVAAHRAGGVPVDSARRELHNLEVEYVEIVDWGGQPTLVVAARSGNTRLIDNVPLDRPELAGLL